MKNIFTTLIAIGVLAFGSITTASTINITPSGGDIVCSETDFLDNDITRCWTGTGTTDASAFNAEDVATATGFSATDDDGNPLLLDVLYKNDYDTGIESGTYDYSYGVTWSGEPNGGLIFDNGSGDIADIIVCSVCFLYVKDGKNDPIWYIFDISTWNGTDDLLLSGFWEGEGVNGSISHVAIFGIEGDKGLIPPVPIPAAAWLFGSGLIGLVGVARRKVTDNNA